MVANVLELRLVVSFDELEPGKGSYDLQGLSLSICTNNNAHKPLIDPRIDVVLHGRSKKSRIIVPVRVHRQRGPERRVPGEGERRVW